MKPIVAILFCLFISSFLGQNDGIWIHPNRGQWHKPILYKVELTCGEMFLEKNMVVEDFLDSELNQYKAMTSRSIARTTVINWELWKVKNAIE